MNKKKTIFKHVLFWVVVYIFYSSSAFQSRFSVESILVANIFHVLIQAMVAYSVLLIIIPRYKKNKNWIISIFLVAILFVVVHFLFSVVVMFFFESVFPSAYAKTKYVVEDFSFFERLTDFERMFFINPLFYVQPLFFLGALLSYEKQQKLSEINEQKKIIELKALKHQLNPHFLFNTLNNLYALALAKSDTTPIVIEKLSGILDYMLYRCDDKYVAIEKEIELIENYLVLEQIRYEDRVTISFQNSVDKSVKIAPLLLLTFIENAFKHGVSQELDMATVHITIGLEKNDIIFKISNSKPPSEVMNAADKKPIGLSNIEKQLELLYPNNYSLNIENGDKMYSVQLKLKQQ